MEAQVAGDEQQLMDKARLGSREAQRIIYECYAGVAMSTALRYVGDEETARDIVQESFVSVLTHLDAFQYRTDHSLRSWIARIVANKSLTVMRHQKLFEQTDVLPDRPDDEPPDDDVGGVPPDVVQAFIRRLPPGYRAVLSLYVFEQYTHKEIASALGISAATSASQFFRAKQMLAQMLRKYRNQSTITTCKTTGDNN